MSPEVAPSGCLRVLVVDDDRDAADSLAMLVHLWGHVVRIEYDALRALDSARSFTPHVVLLDIGLPKIDGHQLAREIRREAGRDAILIAVTGYADEAHRNRCESAFDHYLIKPAPVDEMERLLALVKKTLKLSSRSASDTMQACNTFSLDLPDPEPLPAPTPPSAVSA